MPSIYDILHDRAKYPDDLKITVSGEEMTVKDLRDGALPKAEMTKLTQEAAERERQMKAHYEGQLTQSQAQLAQALANRGLPPTNALEDDLSPYRRDPTFGPLVKLIETQKQEIDGLKQRSQQHEVTFYMTQHLQALEQLRSKDKELDPQALLAFAKTHGYTNLAHAHALMTRDRDLKKAEETAEQRGYEKAKAEVPPPAIPMGGRRSISLAPDAPKTFAEVKEAALKDPEIAQAWSG